MVHAACIIAASSPPPRVRPNARAQADDFLSSLSNASAFSKNFHVSYFPPKSEESPCVQSSGQVRSDPIRFQIRRRSETIPPIPNLF
ncbi:hypothetical protein AVEN_131920-1 [Araneus ventricosus]|uniref:Uncharacterized protein n=1 Tax=Araneus ventricosus TaxID=182803 RepID=A0A4Y2V3R5_ARAVE|nr:hypothetical protein AVEN_131920-1 [Araneus ventricosus]